ncbi:hypothetical protein M0811_14159 [Anaeramoeba ignava]|uniref:Uncharacterized protein n=1 Tax=Anaeramoeba ignava TaxID=1746090 RepID=A0A9Q0LW43_ANAIG|nr:hypothetical protein M0811_14159 [Anaeramoeba ignava]
MYSILFNFILFVHNKEDISINQELEKEVKQLTDSLINERNHKKNNNSISQYLLKITKKIIIHSKIFLTRKLENYFRDNRKGMEMIVFFDNKLEYFDYEFFNSKNLLR